MENKKLIETWVNSIKTLIEEYNLRVLIEEPGVYVEDYIEKMDLDELKQFHIILRILALRYCRFGKYVKLDFYKRPNGEVYAVTFLTNNKKYELTFKAIQFIDYECKIKDELEFLKFVLKNKYIHPQVICDGLISRNRGINNLKVGTKISTFYRGEPSVSFKLERIQFSNKYKDNYVFSNDTEKEKYVFLNKKMDRYACERLLSCINMSSFFREVLYTPLQKEMKKCSEKLNDHIGYRYYYFFYHLYCSYLDLNNGSAIDNPLELDLSIAKNKRGNIDVKITLVPMDKSNSKYNWYKFMAYRNIDLNNQYLKESIDRYGYNEGIMQFLINGDPEDYKPEINYPNWIWNKKYKTW